VAVKDREALKYRVFGRRGSIASQARVTSGVRKGSREAMRVQLAPLSAER
jgi:hypothetical protein